ncbi:MAG: hypothetical protein PHP96_03205 [Candidatus Dojkabacteria bacterium]|jgi:hypothetical protein|nr:hypothetical protein [Candidatus Dojkabacteria bacterium]MDD4561427.1 hypothetical protein [Candidatus Dojkabacteria bacterium]
MAEFIGNNIQMVQKPIINNLSIGKIATGELISRIEDTDEEKALNRWQEGDFSNLEKDFAQKWRDSLPNIISDRNLDLIRNTIPKGLKFKSYEKIYQFTKEFLQNEDEHILYIAQELLRIPQNIVSIAKRHWQSKETKSIQNLFPYTSFVLTIEIIFYIALISELLSREKISNRTDILYLHYLPFTNIFVSSDNLHKKITPLLLQDKQLFITGLDLKIALKELNDYFQKLPERKKSKGVINIARLPTDSDNLVCKIWDNYFPNWREKKPKQELTKKDEKELIAKINRLAKEKIDSTTNSFEDSNEIIRTIRIKRQQGDWNMLPEDLENKD